MPETQEKEATQEQTKDVKQYKALKDKLESIDKQHNDALETIDRNHRKNTWKIYTLFTIFCVMAIAVIVLIIGISLAFIDGKLITELQNTTADSIARNTDYLELVLPILGCLIVAFITFLGMNRLKDVDTQVDQMRNSIRAELEKETKRIAELRRDLSTHIDVAVTAKTQVFASEMEKTLKDASSRGEDAIEQCTSDALSALVESTNNADALLQKAKKDLDEFYENYQWLLANRKGIEDTILQEVATVYDVHHAVEALWNQSEKPNNINDLTRRYVDKVMKASDLRGDEADYHNLAAECARHSLYDLACAVCETGLHSFPKNIDLLADWIQYGTKLGDMVKLRDDPLQRLLSIDKVYWNWRAFDFTVDFYLADGMYEKAEQLARDFMEYMPYEERAYYSMAEVYMKRYAKEDGTQKTIEVLQRALDKGINCPMCANRLAEILSDCGRLEEALEASHRAVQELSQEQPSVNYGYVFYRRALIQDRLAYKWWRENQRERAVSIAEEAYIDYRVAIESCRLSTITTNQARVRRDMLTTYFSVGGKPDGGSSQENLQNLLEFLQSLPDDPDAEK